MSTLFERDQESILHTYSRLPIEIERGDGVYLISADGRRFLDFFGGLAVNGLGYGHPAILNAIRAQIGRYLHLSNLFPQEPQIVLAERLRAATGFSRVYFANSGAETMESAFKLIRRWSAGNDRFEILSFRDAFHGRTMAGLSMMDTAGYREGFGPFLDGCRILPFNDVEALHAAVGPRTAAIVFEPVQGEGGVQPMTGAFANALRGVQEKFGVLLVADEIQTGMGRTGRMLACEHFELAPDIVTLAKSLGGGLPLGGVLVRAELADVFGVGGHGSTFGGNPVACAAGAAVMETLAQGVMENAARMGARLQRGLRDLAAEYPMLISEVRGRGCMQGIACTQSASFVLDHCLRAGLLINITRARVIRLLPPLIITAAHVDEALIHLRNAFADWQASLHL
ncbi:MAG: acetylornithine transaminase [Bacteroidota bacterium]|jgi:predicted acetylornithine/succinylornithine family transaminase|nr:acetylornithine transaminase [Bacteroidota bacterium]